MINYHIITVSSIKFICSNAKLVIMHVKNTKYLTHNCDSLSRKSCQQTQFTCSLSADRVCCEFQRSCFQKIVIVWNVIFVQQIMASKIHIHLGYHPVKYMHHIQNHCTIPYLTEFIEPILALSDFSKCQSNFIFTYYCRARKNAT